MSEHEFLATLELLGFKKEVALFTDVYIKRFTGGSIKYDCYTQKTIVNSRAGDSTFNSSWGHAPEHRLQFIAKTLKELNYESNIKKTMSRET